MTRTDARGPVTAGEDPVAIAASEVLGGPRGRHAARADRVRGGRTPRRRELLPPWRPVAAVLSVVGAVLVAAGVLQKGHCFRFGWGGTDPFWHACFSDLPRLYASTPLVTRAFPYGADGASMDQPVGTGLALWLLSFFVPEGQQGPQWFAGAWAVAAALLVMALVTLLVLCTRRYPWRAAHVACSPLLVALALVSPDLFAITLVVGGLWLWSLERPVAAGVVLGIALSARGLTLVALLALGLVCLRAGVLRRWAVTAGVSVVVAAAIVGGVEVTAGGAFTPYREWLLRAPDYGSIWFLPDLFGHPIPPATATAGSLLGWVLAVGAGVLVALAPRRRPAVAEVALVVLVLVLLTAKSVPVQVSLWFLPFLALAGVRWRVHLVWVTAELFHFVLVWLFIAGAGSTPDRSLPAGWYATALVVRLVGMAYVGWSVHRAAVARPAARSGEVWSERTASDRRAVEAAAVADHDELAGPAAGRADALVVAFR